MSMNLYIMALLPLNFLTKYCYYNENNYGIIHRTIGPSGILRFFLFKEDGLSVRCIKD